MSPTWDGLSSKSARALNFRKELIRSAIGMFLSTTKAPVYELFFNSKNLDLLLEATTLIAKSLAPQESHLFIRRIANHFVHLIHNQYNGTFLQFGAPIFETLWPLMDVENKRYFAQNLLKPWQMKDGVFISNTTQAEFDFCVSRYARMLQDITLSDILKLEPQVGQSFMDQIGTFLGKMKPSDLKSLFLAEQEKMELLKVVDPQSLPPLTLLAHVPHLNEANHQRLSEVLLVLGQSDPTAGFEKAMAWLTEHPNFKAHQKSQDDLKAQAAQAPTPTLPQHKRL